MLALWGDDAATSSSAQNQTLRGQRQECLAHDRAGDAELLLQLRLRGQLASSGQAAIRDTGPQYRAELAVQRSIPTGVDRVLRPRRPLSNRPVRTGRDRGTVAKYSPECSVTRLQAVSNSDTQ